MSTKWKVRRPGLMTGGMQIGSAGTNISGLKTGSVAVEVPQITASGPVVTACILISGLPVGARMFFTNISGCTGVVIAKAVAASTGIVAASFASTTGVATSAACSHSFNYLAVY
jgi:hypothetical protein